MVYSTDVYRYIRLFIAFFLSRNSVNYAYARAVDLTIYEGFVLFCLIRDVCLILPPISN